VSLVDQVREAGVLRVVSRNAPTAYYVGSEGPAGPEFELARGFAEHLGVGLEIYVVDSFAGILPEVIEGRAHLAAAALTVTPSRETRVAFGPEYRRVTHQLIYRQGTPSPDDPAALYGRRIEIVAGSGFVETLERLRQFNPGLTWLENPAADVQELLGQVSAGQIDYTVADSTAFLVNRYFHPDIRVAFDVSEPRPMAWAFREGLDESLVQAARAYFAGLEGSGRLAELMDRYYGHTDRFDYVGTRTFLRHIDTRLPRYRAQFEAAAEAQGLDWRLLAAVGYQESHWNPEAVSPTGVRGIMMLTSPTAQALGVADREDPAESIRGGATYLKQVMRRIPEDIPEPDRTWMALAAYNVGLAHLRDARKVAEARGLDPHRWPDVRDSLPLLTQEKWYRRVPGGYARGWEPVRYVSNIRRYYEVLARITADTTDRPLTAGEPVDSRDPA
jgi:membrane-bound lytic murein transglycosylase F